MKDDTSIKIKEDMNIEMILKHMLLYVCKSKYEFYYILLMFIYSTAYLTSISLSNLVLMLIFFTVFGLQAIVAHLFVAGISCVTSITSMQCSISSILELLSNIHYSSIS